MRRPRNGGATRTASWEDRPPAPVALLGIRQYSVGGSWRPAFGSANGGSGWLGPLDGTPVAGGGTGPHFNDAQISRPGLLQSMRAVMFQLIFWPLTLSLMLAGMFYRFLLHVGTSSSPLTFREPPRWLVRAISWPFRLANPPVVLGAEKLGGVVQPNNVHGSPATRTQAQRGGMGVSTVGMDMPRPVLFVGNHTLLGLDCACLLDKVQGCTGVYPRVLYDTLFGYIPGWRQVAEAAGGAKGTSGNCTSLMSEGRCLMVFPGGAREALKYPSAGEKYKLLWDDKQGFVRMAVRHGYSLLPFASVGLEDAVSVAFTLDVGWLVRRLERDRGRLRIPLLYPYNSLQRQYFAFGDAIDTSHYGGDWENAAKCSEVYRNVKGEVERLIQQLKEQDPDRFLLRRVWRYCCGMFGGLAGVSEVVSGPDMKSR